MTATGPVEYVLIAFPGNQFTGGITPAIAELVENEVIHILDLVFITKDEDGNVTSFEYDEREETEAFAAIEGEAEGVLADEDIAAAAEHLEPNSSSLLIVWEDLWAARLGREIVASGGQLVAGGRIPNQVVSELLAEAERATS